MITPKEIETKALRRYPDYLKSLVLQEEFFPLFIPANRKGSDSFATLHKELEVLIGQSKERVGIGYSLEFKKVISRKHGEQDEITGIYFNCEKDFLGYIGKTTDVRDFKEILQYINEWRESLGEWVLLNINALFLPLEIWKGIFSVVDYLIQNEAHKYYLRSLPVPVHTKFIEQNKSLIYSLIRFINPDRLIAGTSTLETGIGVKQKPYLFQIRWLDIDLSHTCSSGMSLFATTVDYLKQVSWPIKKVLLVENQVNLFLLPPIQESIALVSAGKALHLLKEIPLFSASELFYWGDLDESGFIMLQDIRAYYHSIKSLLMDKETVLNHRKEMSKQPIYRNRQLIGLTEDEQYAYQFLRETNGRIEQEQLNQQFTQRILYGLLD